MIPSRPLFQGWKFTPELAEKIKHYARFPATGVSLRQMVQFGSKPSAGTLFRASQFISEELPIRLAHRVRDLEDLPDGLSEQPSILRVRNWYAQSFDELTSLKQPKISKELKTLLYSGGNNNNGNSNGNGASTTNNGNSNTRSFHMSSTRQTLLPENTTNPSLDEYHFKSTPTQKTVNRRRYYANVSPEVSSWPPEVYEFNKTITATLQKIKQRHDPVVTTVAQGITEWKQVYKKSAASLSIQSFLDRFYMSRIGIRMLIGQHIALNLHAKQEDYVGIICTKTNVREVVQDAIANARFICEDWYGLFEAPKVEIVCQPDINFMYVPGHLSHMLFETLKNSLRAVVETHGVDADYYPPVKVIVAEGHEDITIKISDEGGGIPRSAIPLIWTYLYTTVEATPSLEPDFNKSDFKAPMAGFGYGLPISRLYARYFGGDLKLISMEGYGTDVYLHLNRLSSSSEPLQ
ncbi:mitochondrial branched-chain alpha-ketoacid dehydrogenase kinase-domain-containing protein [Yarrowia lipolytica]|uniref:Protein-serine/threonine kinase n=2 Tax=Yarrowia lipolytica TaxID=4952 RepID=Q6CB64_YARLI|nr:YALI0C21582p [Yarrowia lipolytica CLIB122]KAB8281144.1 mitochondrial branched-chain alpha-ketoacid dehydrogenase kinase-domain-containing protein [Yarrowia lipolytica]KAE8172983.1 mitochondrial branched-chain alpha-ketoacid dehydrogenase kinase-domain-containing protein [Yarrowia lipolytica]RDW27130.1 mitochondrial branched-chain alpha-ketoacid dehydrogenase kinase-domain-containing protein [Yarrowia lipolytica]RDW32681.1 mitochondrial branched-chain alpha-ketoacid dehydrogenase kinase-domai|eukprot:XP_502098.2 YALI0C21582p [Yarrowia lipolytica CLIB122]